MTNDHQVRRFAEARTRLREARHAHTEALRELEAAQRELETAASAIAERLHILTTTTTNGVTR